MKSERERQTLAWADTLRAAALDQAERGRIHDAATLILRADDLRFRRRCQSAGRLLLFVVDASGSMAAWRRMRETKAAILALLLRAYRQRDRIALLTFGGTGTRLVLPPTRGLAAPRRALEELAVGGATPLAHGLSAAFQIMEQQRRRQNLPIWAVLLSDGRANVTLHSDDPWTDALHEARRLAAVSDYRTVIDTETGWPRLGRAAPLARASQANCVSLEAVLGREVPARWEAAS
jgi:magnesium chelatase subunit D